MSKRIHWTTKKVINTLPNLPHTKGYTLLSKYTTEKDLLWWRYIDPSKKVHYFLLCWDHFLNTGIRFYQVQLSHRDIIQEVYDVVGNEYTVLCVAYDCHKDEQKFKLLVRHNCKRCNYSEHWVELHDFLVRGGGCFDCNLIYEHTGNISRRSNSQLLKIVFNQYDNKDHKYIPDLSNYKNGKTRLKWTKRYNNGHNMYFIMCMDAFIAGERPDGNMSKNEKYFQYLLNNYCKKLLITKDYFHSYHTYSTHKYGRGYNMSFDYFFSKYKVNYHHHSYNGIVVELNGLQHKIPTNIYRTKSHKYMMSMFKYQQKRDRNKQNYCNAQNILLLWIPCYYKSLITGKITSDSFTTVKRNIKKYFVNILLPLLTHTYKSPVKYKQLSLL